jgi:hypothetical protein
MAAQRLIQFRRFFYESRIAERTIHAQWLSCKLQCSSRGSISTHIRPPKAATAHDYRSDGKKGLKASLSEIREDCNITTCPDISRRSVCDKRDHVEPRRNHLQLLLFWCRVRTRQQTCIQNALTLLNFLRYVRCR